MTKEEKAMRVEMATEQARDDLEEGIVELKQMRKDMAHEIAVEEKNGTRKELIDMMIGSLVEVDDNICFFHELLVNYKMIEFQARGAKIAVDATKALNLIVDHSLPSYDTSKLIKLTKNINAGMTKAKTSMELTRRGLRYANPGKKRAVSDDAYNRVKSYIDTERAALGMTVPGNDSFPDEIPNTNDNVNVNDDTQW